MTSYYSSHHRYYVAVDCVIFSLYCGRLSLLLAKRRFEPALGCWSLMGGFVGENESVDDAAKRVLGDLTGLDDVYMEQVGAFGDLNRDPAERVVSVAYYALINSDGSVCAKTAAHGAMWVDLAELPPLSFDHPQMVAKALEKLRKKMDYQPVGTNLLPKLFTLTQLQTVYEAIYGERLDKRNFRKRVGSMRFIEKTDMIDKSSSRRGACLYRFNDGVYSQMQKNKL